MTTNVVPFRRTDAAYEAQLKATKTLIATSVFTLVKCDWCRENPGRKIDQRAIVEMATRAAFFMEGQLNSFRTAAENEADKACGPGAGEQFAKRLWPGK